jgi:hypothetical protein
MKIIKSISGKLKRAYNSYTIGDYMRTAYLFQKIVLLSLETGNFSSEMIASSKCFAINFMNAEFEKQILECSRTSGRNSDKFKKYRI